MRALATNLAGFAQALPIVARFRPSAVIATGGYTSWPVVAAAAFLRVVGFLRGTKIALIEPNVGPGLANRMLSRFADEIWGAYDETAAHFPDKFVKTGAPVRSSLYSLPAAAAARRALSLDPALRTLLVFGGSQGARTLNVALSSMVAMRRLPAAWQVLHLSGDRDYAWMAANRKSDANENRYLLLPYLNDMELAYAAADVAVTRAGASTIAELAVTGVPSILVPYPYASEDHQRKNAELFAHRGAAVIIADANLNADTLYWSLIDILQPDKLASMKAAAHSLAQPRALHLMIERILDV